MMLEFLYIREPYSSKRLSLELIATFSPGCRAELFTGLLNIESQFRHVGTKSVLAKLMRNPARAHNRRVLGPMQPNLLETGAV